MSKFSLNIIVKRFLGFKLPTSFVLYLRTLQIVQLVIQAQVYVHHVQMEVMLETLTQCAHLVDKTLTLGETKQAQALHHAVSFIFLN